MTGKELKRQLRADGWVVTQGGSHEQAKHPSKPGLKVSIPRHTGDIPTGTLNKILKDTGLK